MNCTDAYRAALTRDFQATTAPGLAPGHPQPQPAPAAAADSGPATAPGTGPDDTPAGR